MGTRTADCRKFSPNIFNKSKCSHCFRQREEHSAAALECNRVSSLTAVYIVFFFYILLFASSKIKSHTHRKQKSTKRRFKEKYPFHHKVETTKKKNVL